MVTVITRRGSIVERGLRGEANVKRIVLPELSRFELLRRVVWEALRMPAVAARERSDLVISMSGMLPRAPDCRVICLLFNPVMYENDSAANRLRRRAVRHTARRASYVAAPSRHMADLVSASIKAKCAVVPLGVEHGVFAPAADAGKEGVGEEILCVADFYAHKRHDLLLDAWLLLPAPRPVLHLIGNPAVDPHAYAALLAQTRTLPEADSIVLEHGISLDRLVDAYHRARVFVMPSERESFCMPLVESMACGVPAVARGLPSLRETGGVGARYVDSDDPAEWATAMRQLLEDPVAHDRVREAAIQAAARFSWAALAADIVSHLS
jgi:glycosyltransferase involved in cell wall biosynthesis